VILAVKEVISASVCSLISPKFMLAGEAKVATEKSVTLHSKDAFIFATTKLNRKDYQGEVQSWIEVKLSDSQSTLFKFFDGIDGIVRLPICVDKLMKFFNYAS
jgi:hypothetical protein